MSRASNRMKKKIPFGTRCSPHPLVGRAQPRARVPCAAPRKLTSKVWQTVSIAVMEKMLIRVWSRRTNGGSFESCRVRRRTSVVAARWSSLATSSCAVPAPPAWPRATVTAHAGEQTCAVLRANVTAGATAGAASVAHTLAPTTEGQAACRCRPARTSLGMDRSRNAREKSCTELGAGHGRA